MERVVNIVVKSSIENEQGEETFEFRTVGRLIEKGKTVYLQYEEQGDQGITKTVIKVREKDILLLRSGPIKMRMLFSLHKKLQGKMETPLGTLILYTTTKKWLFSHEKKGTIEILYDLEIQDSQVGTYHLHISFEEENG